MYANPMPLILLFFLVLVAGIWIWLRYQREQEILRRLDALERQVAELRSGEQSSS
ncbi:MAG: hypothetical protein M0Z66_15320 [Thermaerobacter sp.]|nr:hypothetical protein [Thermaerobacter sp.]